MSSLQTITVREYGRIPRHAIDRRTLHRLQKSDEEYAAATGTNVFDWRHVAHIRALNHVGVIQIDRVAIEILPKIDVPELLDTSSQSIATALARQNLTYMLSVAKRVPVHDRDVAALLARRLPLLEALMASFADRLIFELGRGLHHEYVHRNRTRPFVRGKIRLADQVRLHRDRPDRLCLSFDEFMCDTPLNRILKAACRRMLGLARSTHTQQRLREAVLMLSGVADVAVTRRDCDETRLDRRASRFETLFSFATMVLTGWSPVPQSGASRSISFLFPMDRLFEEFIGAFMIRYAPELGLPRSAIHAQARGRRKWLVRAEDGRGRFRLIPDIVIDGPSRPPLAIIDTKWKRPTSDAEDARNSVSQADMYQLYAYATRYECLNSVLLYPKVADVTSKTYRIDDGTGSTAMRIEFVDLGVDLRQSPGSLIADLRRVIRPLVPRALEACH